MGQIASFSQKGDFNKTTKFLKFVSNNKYIENKLEQYGRQGVAALASATPVDTGKTAASWSYEIVNNYNGIGITWKNSNIAEPTQVSVAILIQYGHATKDGRFIKGIDFINPVIRPIFEKISDEIWREVTDK